MRSVQTKQAVIAEEEVERRTHKVCLLYNTCTIDTQISNDIHTENIYAYAHRIKLFKNVNYMDNSY